MLTWWLGRVCSKASADFVMSDAIAAGFQAMVYKELSSNASSRVPAGLVSVMPVNLIPAASASPRKTATARAGGVKAVQ